MVICYILVVTKIVIVVDYELLSYNGNFSDAITKVV